jgi:hypothetical protein
MPLPCLLPVCGEYVPRCPRYTGRVPVSTRIEDDFAAVRRPTRSPSDQVFEIRQLHHVRAIGRSSISQRCLTSRGKEMCFPSGEYYGPSCSQGEINLPGRPADAQISRQYWLALRSAGRQSVRHSRQHSASRTAWKASNRRWLADLA